MWLKKNSKQLQTKQTIFSYLVSKLYSLAFRSLFKNPVLLCGSFMGNFSVLFFHECKLVHFRDPLNTL